ncbi:transcriptional regulator, TetR family [Xylanimonas cellulosilytica DSM 15894]|uniref:Transcriptional regulator, TetR family n=1 Tax=Xylanimonas cellulosilytica (strain DSM 15894 / JCM 12276 / CECT 5975 / KCTC 9989 / LMG 20990 / NBRC 107835 / XIL07) TaxID=446471 RepID=D1BTF5_XYLCX|nr:TetR/AcrR family transcriptional regulator [Xylanimonas cellulosilytica]ACZ29097.1 transcriptional regulator, TetR family [Xylanimonas cellulosilytica DSM 15894]
MSTPDDATARLVQRMWAPPTPPRRGPKPGLSVDRIIEAAYELAEAEGIEAVSMARLGSSLGVSAMALYRHVSNKDELLTLLADRLARDLPPIGDVATWREGLDLWTRAQIMMVLEHPWFLDLPLSTVMPGPHRLRWIDSLFGLLAETPLSVDEKFAFAGLLAQHVLGEARILVESQRAAAAAEPGAATSADPFGDLGTLLHAFADPADFPHLMAAIETAEGETRVPVMPPDAAAAVEEEITFGLNVVLDGLEAYVAGRQAASPPSSAASPDSAASSGSATPSSDGAATA